jgi:hypothetical protein
MCREEKFGYLGILYIVTLSGFVENSAIFSKKKYISFFVLLCCCDLALISVRENRMCREKKLGVSAFFI